MKGRCASAMTDLRRLSSWLLAFTASLALGSARAAEPGAGPSMEVGDISKEGGGFLPPHVSHRNGLDVDVFVIAKKGKPQDVCDAGYDAELTAHLAEVLGKDPKTEVIFSGDPTLPGTVYWKGLREHLHMRMSEEGAKRMTMSREALARARADYDTVCGRTPVKAIAGEPGDAALLERAARVPASALIAASPAIKHAAVPLKGSIAEYIVAVAHTNGVGVLGAREVVACQAGGGRCVRLAGAPCANAKKKDGCEGVSLVVTVGFANDGPVLVEALGPTLSPVRSQADVERLISLSP
jgi:murein endopeptidase